MRRIVRPTNCVLAITCILGFALLLFASAHFRAQRAARPVNAVAPSSVGLPAVGLTMADFTGDGNPDLATVMPAGFEAQRVRYLVEIRLTEGGHQFIRLTAPFGGVQITPEDVTGDGNLDLIVRVARSSVPAAVFLNDGHGHFSPAPPEVFARVLHEDVPGPELTADHPYFGALSVSSESHTIGFQNRSERDLLRYASRFVPTDQGAPAASALFFGLNRAPPTSA